MENLTSIPIADLQKIEELYRNNDNTLPNFLKEVTDKYGFDFKGWVLTSSYGSVFSEFEGLINFFPSLAEVTEEIVGIRDSNLSYTEKHFKAFQVISTTLKSKGGKLIATLIPEGGSDRSYLLFADLHLVEPIILLYHFNETMNMAPNYDSFDEFIQIYDVGYEEFIKRVTLSGNPNVIDVVEYTVEESPFGTSCPNNLDALNMDKENFNLALKGMKSAKSAVN